MLDAGPDPNTTLMPPEQANQIATLPRMTPTAATRTIPNTNQLTRPTEQDDNRQTTPRAAETSSLSRAAPAGFAVTQLYFPKRLPPPFNRVRTDLLVSETFVHCKFVAA